MPGMRTSSGTQSVSAGSNAERKSAAEPKAIVAKPSAEAALE